MNTRQIELLSLRFIEQMQKFHGDEPLSEKEKNDLQFCESFFGSPKPDTDYIFRLLIDSIETKNETDLDYLIMLIDHFEIGSRFAVQLAPLLIQPWHHMHDSIARMLMWCAVPQTAQYLYEGATYRCENLKYQSDYGEFNRKCMYGLKNINSDDSIKFLKSLAEHKEPLYANMAQKLLREDDKLYPAEHSAFTRIMSLYANGFFQHELACRDVERIEVASCREKTSLHPFIMFRFHNLSVLWEFKQDSYRHIVSVVDTPCECGTSSTTWVQYDESFDIIVFVEEFFQTLNRDERLKVSKKSLLKRMIRRRKCRRQKREDI